ncbi:cytochrome c [Kozakia baliensis]|uniref:c-type cytochrome n=1 Tax=Kozakia baliensis TaxID=153496 RepID=UPI00345B634D
MKKSALPLLALMLSATPALADADGANLYGSNCSACHQAGGKGSPGQFPPLAGRLDKIAATPEGKTYLAYVLLNGLHGSIQASGARYAGFMPPFKSLSDDQIAAILTYLVSLGDTKPAPVFTTKDIQVARSTPKKAKEVAAERQALDTAHPIP